MSRVYVPTLCDVNSAPGGTGYVTVESRCDPLNETEMAGGSALLHSVSAPAVGSTLLQ